MQIVSRSPAHEQWLDLLRQHRAIAVIRTDDFQHGLKMAEAVEKSGMRLLEVTWNSDRPGELINTLRNRFPHCTVGVGTVLSRQALQEAIQAGAQFAFSPHTDPQLIEFSAAQDFPLTAGALSPSEILTAWQAGAASVKVFPAQSVGGAQYVKNLQGPLGHIPLIPTGGISCEAAPNYLQAGAIAVGLAGCLFSKPLIQREDWPGLAKHIQIFRENLISHAQNIR